MGYVNATAVPERVFHDDQHVLDIIVSIKPGPLRFGQLQIVELSPTLEAQARKMWTLNAGDPFDYTTPRLPVAGKQFVGCFQLTGDGNPEFKPLTSGLCVTLDLPLNLTQSVPSPRLSAFHLNEGWSYSACAFFGGSHSSEVHRSRHREASHAYSDSQKSYSTVRRHSSEWEHCALESLPTGGQEEDH